MVKHCSFLSPLVTSITPWVAYAGEMMFGTLEISIERLDVQGKLSLLLFPLCGFAGGVPLLITGYIYIKGA